MASSSSTAAISNPLFGLQISEKLNKQNHPLWAAQVLTTLRGAQLEGHILGTTAAPAAEIERGDGDKKIKAVIPNPEYTAWFVQDQQSAWVRLLLSITRGAATSGWCEDGGPGMEHN